MRCETSNNPIINGEYWLIRQVVDSCGDGAIFFDVGANQGAWSRQVVEVARGADKRVSILAFEPCSGTRAILSQSVAGYPEISVRAIAVSNREGDARFYSSGAGEGTNSLHQVSGDSAENVPMSTIDGVIEREGIGEIKFLKIDVEGFDALVLEGARGALKNSQIEIIQFEYNWRWLLNGRSLYSIFSLVDGLNYMVAKLAGNRLYIFDAWHQELDRFFEGNYVLVRRGSKIEALAVKCSFDASNALSF
jgi:FkbM family methyltransferase